MPVLDTRQQQRAVEAMQECLAAPRDPDGKTYLETALERDEMRLSLIAENLKPLLDGYLGGKIALADFKAKIDSTNKRHTNWGFKGIKGQMFFNMVVNTATDLAECDQELKAALVMPASNELAKSRIRTFASYAKRLGEDFVEAGGSKHGRPKVGSVPFFLSYFWQIQDWKVWPVFYTNSVQVMDDLNLWRPSGDIADDYILFKHIHEELAKLFTEKSGQPFNLYTVEHVFWFQGGNQTVRASQRLLKIRFTLSNEGTAPADDIDVHVVCPAHFSLFAMEGSDEVKAFRQPPPPTPPEAPKSRMDRITEIAMNVEPAFLRRGRNENEESNTASALRHADGSHEFRATVRRLKRLNAIELGVVWAVVDAWEAVKPFEASFSISTANHPRRAEGRLVFKVVRKGNSL